MPRTRSTGSAVSPVWTQAHASLCYLVRPSVIRNHVSNGVKEFDFRAKNLFPMPEIDNGVKMEFWH